jgi:hypothetical protein
VIISSLFFCLFASPVPNARTESPSVVPDNPMNIMNNKYHKTDNFLMTGQDVGAMFKAFKEQEDDVIANVAFYILIGIHD